MDNAQLPEIEPQRQRPEPRNDFIARFTIMPVSTQKSRMLADVLIAAFAQPGVDLDARRMKSDRVEFMISHHRLCRAGVDHWPHDFNDLALQWPAIDKVPTKSAV